MKHYYWCGDAVIALFLRGRHCDFLLGLLAKCGTVHTAACTVTEFHLAVAKATNEGRLRPGGGDALRKAFDDAIRLRRIVLFPEDSGSPGDELIHSEIRKHLSKLDPLTVVHLTTAQQRGFRYFVTCEEHAVPLSRIWGLRPVTPATAMKEESLDPYKNRLERIRSLFAEMESCCGALCSVGEDMGAETTALSASLADLGPRISAARIEKRRVAFFAILDRVQEDVTSAELVLSFWETATNNVAAKVDPDDEDEDDELIQQLT